MSNALVLLDESGDLGWIFNFPYRKGGSSRFFTIAAAMGVNNSHRKFGKVVRELRKAQNWTSAREKKWVNISNHAKESFANRVVKLSEFERDIHLLVTVVEKERVPQHIRGHFHLLYAWMASSLIGASGRVHRQLSICPDELNAGSGSQSLIENMLRKELWFTLRAQTIVTRVSRSGPLEDGLTFCDFLAGAVQSHFEDKSSIAYNILKDSIFLHHPWQ